MYECDISHQLLIFNQIFIACVFAGHILVANYTNFKGRNNRHQSFVNGSFGHKQQYSVEIPDSYIVKSKGLFSSNHDNLS